MKQLIPPGGPVAVADGDAFLMVRGLGTDPVPINVLDFAEKKANRGIAGGYASLNANRKIPRKFLPGSDDVQNYDSLDDFPTTGSTGVVYVADDTQNLYTWDGSDYALSLGVAGTTDTIAEGAINFYHTGARVLATLLTGYAPGSAGAIASSDTILQALTKIQASIDAGVALADGDYGDIIVSGGGADLALDVNMTSIPYTSFKQPVLAAATTNFDIATGGVTAGTGVTIDSQDSVDGGRYLLPNQTITSENGIYNASASGAWTRASDATHIDMLAGCIVVAQASTASGGRAVIWCTSATSSATVGSSGLNWFKIPTGASADLRDSTTTFTDNNDATKTGRFQLSGVSTGTLRTLTWPNLDGTIALLTDITTAVDATYTAVDNSQTGTTYTLVLADAKKEVRLSHATGCALSIPLNATVAFPVGTRIPVWNDSLGTHTIVGVSGVTLNGVSGGSRTGTMTINASGQRCGVVLCKTATDTWTVVGAIGTVA